MGLIHMGYQIDTRNLSTIRQDIRENIIAKLEAARTGLLSDVASIVYGDRTDIGSMENMPQVWILPEAHQPMPKGGHTTIHDFRFNFIALVYNLDPNQGKDQAEDLIGRVYDVIIADRSLNGKVFDVIPLSFDPSYEAVANSNVYWSACEFAFRIQRKE